MAQKSEYELRSFSKSLPTRFAVTQTNSTPESPCEGCVFKGTKEASCEVANSFYNAALNNFDPTTMMDYFCDMSTKYLLVHTLTEQFVEPTEVVAEYRKHFYAKAT